MLWKTVIPYEHTVKIKEKCEIQVSTVTEKVNKQYIYKMITISKEQYKISQMSYMEFPFSFMGYQHNHA